MSKKAKIYYFSLTDEMTKREKLDWFADNHIKNTPFEIIKPDKDANWLNITDNDFEELLPVCSKEVKGGKSEQAIFKLYCGAIKTNRDDWVYDFTEQKLLNKIQYFVRFYNQDVEKLHTYKNISQINDLLNYSIKWSRDLKNELLKNRKIIFDIKKMLTSSWRPFVKKAFYSDYLLNDVLTNNHFLIFGETLNNNNQIISICGGSSMKPFQILATDGVSDYEFVEKNQMLPLYRYDSSGNRIENITDWGLGQFRDYYEDGKILKADIFHYVYAVLHNPAYRKKYEQNLKREFPRVPFYADFWKWASWGEALMALHIDYESVEAYDLEVVASRIPKENPQAKLRLDKNKNGIILDENTEIHGIPKLALSYKLGNRSALEWILDQYKEKKPRDPTIREKFNTYRFADYKEQVIDLLKRVTTVSVRTMEIVNQMAEEGGHD